VGPGGDVVGVGPVKRFFCHIHLLLTPGGPGSPCCLSARSRLEDLAVQKVVSPFLKFRYLPSSDFGSLLPRTW
jgi:hypothetical protein